MNGLKIVEGYTDDSDRTSEALLQITNGYSKSVRIDQQCIVELLGQHWTSLNVLVKFFNSHLNENVRGKNAFRINDSISLTIECVAQELNIAGIVVSESHVTVIAKNDLPDGQRKKMMPRDVYNGEMSRILRHVMIETGYIIAPSCSASIHVDDVVTFTHNSESVVIDLDKSTIGETFMKNLTVEFGERVIDSIRGIMSYPDYILTWIAPDEWRDEIPLAMYSTSSGEDVTRKMSPTIYSMPSDDCRYRDAIPQYSTANESLRYDAVRRYDTIPHSPHGSQVPRLQCKNMCMKSNSLCSCQRSIWFSSN